MQAFITLRWAFHIALYVCLASATITPGGKKQTELKVKSGPLDSSVFDLNLIQQEPISKDILENGGAYYKHTNIKNFNGTVLGFVTPWNSHGYDVAKIFAGKFDIISPVWFQIVKKGDDYKVQGTHDIDSGWMKSVRDKGTTARKTIEIFPRFLFENFRNEDFSKLFSSDKEKLKLANVLTKICVENGFKGVVMEYWLQLAGHVNDNYLIKLTIDLSKALRANNLQVVLVIPPYRQQMANIFNSDHFDQLHRHVYKFSLMTYDYSNVQRPGANSPIYWIKQSIEHITPPGADNIEEKRSKILMGMNMYGNDYTPDGGGPIVSNEFLSLLKHLKKRLVFDEKDVENFFEVKTHTGRHYVFYPTLYSINERIKLAQEMGVGIAIWELGQGLDYFYDLF
ncbi:chitinase domain-containing protein 1 [Haematobia irritans]|uniref:chitinase domain-containing protein 1 n=1 Tax=Haematobia irritans TaxID=7368 RepID=UPI003F500238